jgi:hypothetical protein
MSECGISVLLAGQFKYIAACGEASMKVRGNLKLRLVLMSSSRPGSSGASENNVVKYWRRINERD